jgi:hypothetical protein
MTSNRSRRPMPRAALALVIALVIALTGCSGSGGSGDGAQLSGGELRSNGSDTSDAAREAEQPPELLADKEIPTECADELGTGDPAFEAAFCAYRAAALAATSGPDGVSAVDPSALSAGDDAVALFASDPTAARELLEAATAELAG